MMILTTQLQRQRGGAFAFFSHRLTSATSLKVPVSKITTPFASRSFANSGRPLRGYAQYIVHTEATMFSLRAILPVFKNVKGESIGADMTKKGKILIELTPRGTNGYVWADQVKFALTAEELGLICSQLPQVGVEFVRTSRNSQDYDYSGVTGMGGDLPDKVLRISPGDGCTVIFTADFVKDGVGGHSPMPSYSGPPGSPLVCTLQPGEFKVVQTLMESSIPLLTGWSTVLELGMKHALDEAMPTSGGSSGGYSGGNIVPF